MARPVLCHRPALPLGAPVTGAGRFAPDAALYAADPGAALRLSGGGGLWLTVGRPAAGYVALAFDLPAAMAADLSSGHDLRVVLTIARMAGRPLPAAAHLRLSVEDAGEPWRMTVPLVLAEGPAEVALGPGPGLPPRLPRCRRRGWIDLVLTGAGGSALGLRDLTIRRAPAPVL